MSVYLDECQCRIKQHKAQLDHWVVSAIQELAIIRGFHGLRKSEAQEWLRWVDYSQFLYYWSRAGMSDRFIGNGDTIWHNDYAPMVRRVEEK